MYKNRKDVRLHVKLCAALAYIPPENIDEGWLSIMKSSPEERQIQLFNDYFVEEWLDNNNLKRIWNCYGQRHRTTNGAEELIKTLKDNSLYYNGIYAKAELG